MATKQSKTILKMLSELDCVFQQIDAMDRAICTKEQALDFLEQKVNATANERLP